MPPARPRNIDDSRSETSSTVTNQKEKSALGPTSGPSVSKGKRAPLNVNGSAGGHKASVNGPSAPPALPATEVDKDPDLPRTEWTTMSTRILRTYRIAHRLPVPATFSHPHAELTYKSSGVALRAPSAVQYRRKLREQQIQRRKIRQAQVNGVSKGSKTRERERSKAKDASAHSTTKSSTLDPSIAQSIEPPDNTSDTGLHPPSSPSSASTYLGPREPVSQLANSVRKHFNAQQLSESDTIARFIYVVQQNGRGVRTEGSYGDGTGHWMGSHGREVRRMDGPGGEVGFRLRFRP